MGIAEFLDAPDGAVLVAINGEVELVTTHHETATKLTIERFPLGPVVAPAAVMALLGMTGMLPAAAVPAVPDRPALAAPDVRPHVCSACGERFVKKSGLTSHQRAKHGLPAVPPIPYTGEAACTLCARTFKNQHALDVHLARGHRGAAWSTKPAATTPPVAAPMTPPAPEPPALVSLDVAAVNESPVTSEPPVSKDRKVKGTPVADGVCPVCHEPLVTHEVCEGCRVLIGAAHVTERGVFIGGATYCRDCAETRMARRRAEREAA